MCFLLHFDGNNHVNDHMFVKVEDRAELRVMDSTEPGVTFAEIPAETLT